MLGDGGVARAGSGSGGRRSWAVGSVEGGGGEVEGGDSVVESGGGEVEGGRRRRR